MNISKLRIKSCKYIINLLSNGEVSLLKSSKKYYSCDDLREKYRKHRELWILKKLPDDVNYSAVFANNELDLCEVHVYGFDYDYTLAQYSPLVESLIYELGKQNLVAKFKYPREIECLHYNPSFAVRGLHYDIENGYLMKLDQFQQIQPGSIYKGLTPVPKEDVRKTYGSRALPLDYVEGHLHGRRRMAHLADIFSMPEMCLLRQVAQHFMHKNLPYDSVLLFNDVKNAIAGIHPEMHRIVTKDIKKYLIKDPKLINFFECLKEAGKKSFIISNSPFDFIDSGLKYLLGEHWQDYFEVVIASAKKPDFFLQVSRPFREYNKEVHMLNWQPVTQLDSGKVYLEGNVDTLQKMKGWKAQEILYFGDHPYSDLADVTLRHLWRTGAIIWELDYEISCINSIEYKKISGWLQMLQKLIESCQDGNSIEEKQIIQEWIAERDKLRLKSKQIFNPYFGSVFRTYDNPTYFSRRLFRFADIYTSSLSNLNNYSPNHVFYPRKGVLPHEYKSLFV